MRLGTRSQTSLVDQKAGSSTGGSRFSACVDQAGRTARETPFCWCKMPIIGRSVGSTSCEIGAKTVACVKNRWRPWKPIYIGSSTNFGFLDACLDKPSEPSVPKSIDEAIPYKFKLTAAVRAQYDLKDWTATENAWSNCKKLSPVRVPVGLSARRSAGGWSFVLRSKTRVRIRDCTYVFRHGLHFGPAAGIVARPNVRRCRGYA